MSKCSLVQKPKLTFDIILIFLKEELEDYMSEKKANKKMSASRTVKVKKMSARMSNWIYLKAKFIADAQGLTMEQKLTELFKKDIQYVSNQKWFIEYMKEEGINDFNTFGTPQQRRGVKGDLPEESSDDSDFDANNLNGGDDYDPI